MLLIKLQLLQHVTVKTKMRSAVNFLKEKDAVQSPTLWDPK